jgi:hypothetical protein
LSGAAGRIRETAKWLIVSFAAVGAVLIGGVQVSDLGELDVDEPRFWLALAGLALALAAVGGAIERTSRVLVGEPVTLTDLAEATETDSDLVRIRKRLEDDRSLMVGADPRSVATLLDEVIAAEADRRQTYAAHRRNPEAPELRSAAEDADANATLVTARAQDVLEVAGLLAVSAEFRRARKWMLWLAAAAAAGVALFVASASGADDDADSGPPGARAVRTVSVETTAVGEALLGPFLGGECDAGRVTAIVLGQNAAGLDVATLPTPRCSSVRFALTPELGRAERR